MHEGEDEGRMEGARELGTAVWRDTAYMLSILAR